MITSELARGTGERRKEIVEGKGNDSQDFESTDELNMWTTP